MLDLPEMWLLGTLVVVMLLVLIGTIVGDILSGHDQEDDK